MSRSARQMDAGAGVDDADVVSACLGGIGLPLALALPLWQRLRRLGLLCELLGHDAGSVRGRVLCAMGGVVTTAEPLETAAVHCLWYQLCKRQLLEKVRTAARGAPRRGELPLAAAPTHWGSLHTGDPHTLGIPTRGGKTPEWGIHVEGACGGVRERVPGVLGAPALRRPGGGRGRRLARHRETPRAAVVWTRYTDMDMDMDMDLGT
eukprot:2439282-Prymnesium_polylepis.1